MELPLIDGTAGLIVVGGTLVATVMRCGPAEVAIALRSLRAALGHGYRAEEGKAELAVPVRAIREDGLLRARPADHVDRAFAEATEALVHDRSLAALLAALEKHKVRRVAEAEMAVRVYTQAAELAPVFGMAGTLIALSHLSTSDLSAGEAITGAIALSVVTTLYGILLANLLFAPLARLIERVAAREEAARQEVVDWLAVQIADALPSRRPAPHGHGRGVAYGAEAA